MNKNLKHLAVMAVIAVSALSAQANAASVSIRLGNAVAVSIDNNKKGCVQKQHRVDNHRIVHDLRDRRHVDHCRACHHELERRAAARRFRMIHRHHR